MKGKNKDNMVVTVLTHCKNIHESKKAIGISDKLKCRESEYE